MGYIKDLYAKDPNMVKRMIKKLFNLKKDEDVIGLCPDKDVIDENDIMFGLKDKKTGEITEVVLEDFAICYGLEYLEIGDKRLRGYLKFMAKVYKNEYLQVFHNYRTQERKEFIKELISEFDAMEADLTEAINSLNKKDENKTL